jgi:hypothetical protein
VSAIEFATSRFYRRLNPAVRTPTPWSERTMASNPEIHVISAGACKGKSGFAKLRQQKGKAKRNLVSDSSANAVSNKRRRVTAQLEAQASLAPVSSSPPALLRPQLQRGAGTTQSFRHLFSFGSRTAGQPALPPIPAVGRPPAVAESAVGSFRIDKDERLGPGSVSLALSDRMNGEVTSINDAQQQKELSLFSLSGRGVNADQSQLSPFLSQQGAQVSHGRATSSRLAEEGRRRAVAEYVVRDGLATDDGNVMSLARSFCGADRTINDLETEWLEGGRKETMREDLRMRRQKRLRGRALGASSMAQTRA